MTLQSFSTNNISLYVDNGDDSPNWLISELYGWPNRVQKSLTSTLTLLVFIEKSKTRALSKQKLSKIFRFEKLWLEKEGCLDVVEGGWNKEDISISFTDRVNRCSAHLSKWNRRVFGNIKKKIQIVKANLDALQSRDQCAEIILESQQFQKELDELLKLDEIWWFQRSRALWLKDVDCNTPFFHAKASQRRRRNTVTKIQNS
ncbi:hypothetical protein ACS0TY_021325 [Phlomoides rotata]